MQELEQCALIINDWMNENKLKMNASKTKSIMFGSRQEFAKFITTSINVENDNFEKQKYICYFGAFHDESLQRIYKT